MENAAKDILVGVPRNGDPSIRWTPADSDFREFLEHLVVLLGLEYVELMRSTADPEDLAAWEAAVSGKGNTAEVHLDDARPGEQEVCGDGKQPTTTTVQVADKRKGGSDGKEA